MPTRKGLAYRRTDGLVGALPAPDHPLFRALLAEQLPRGITLIELAQPTATLIYDAVWHQGERPLIQRSLEVAAQLANHAGWL